MNSDDGKQSIAAFMLRMRTRGLTDKRLLKTIESVPRQNFVPGQWLKDAYSERMIPIDCGQTLEGLDLQARIFAALDIQENHRILEIGTGSGFSAAVMSRLGQRVTSVDRYSTLCEAAQVRVRTLEMHNVIIKHADGSAGLSGEGPFDRIVAWSAFDSLPRAYVELLSSTGIMIAAIGPGDSSQKLARLTRIGSRFERNDIAEVRFQPMISGLANVL